VYVSTPAKKEITMHIMGDGLTPEQALAKLDALYEQTVSALGNAIGQSN